MVFVNHFDVNSSNLRDHPQFIESNFRYTTTNITTNGNQIQATPIDHHYIFRTQKEVARTGVMLVGWGGNNGSTLTASILANKLSLQWNTKFGEKSSNYYGSLIMSSTIRLGSNELGQDVHAPIKSLLPMLNPNDIVLGGWDINNANIAQAVERAQVLDYDLQSKLKHHLSSIVPLPSIYYSDYVASNQKQRANNILSGKNKKDHLNAIRRDIRNFKQVNHLEQVIVVWTATTERFSDILPGINDTSQNLLDAIDQSHSEVSPSTIFAIASILEGVPYINGSPQNTFVPGCIQLAEEKNVFIAGDDFKSGQTKFKSVMVDFLVNAGIKPVSIVSYNHLGNNDGKNLSAPSQFRAKEISKSNVVDDMVESNRLLYEPGEHPDHVVVIKYVPAVSDSKRAMDEYTSEIFMNGTNTIVIHNTCEDSLLAVPLILDLVILCELSCRVTYKTKEDDDYKHFHPVLSLLSYMLKAPVVPKGAPIVNALFRQRACIENLLRVCAGLPVENDLRLEHRTIGIHDGILTKKKVLENGHAKHMEHVNGDSKHFDS